jgi:hypothetical protein
MNHSTLSRYAPMRRISARRALQSDAYSERQAQFLREHPYCQVWLAERGIPERMAIEQRGTLRFGPGVSPVFVPRSQVVHHRNKRRGARLLDEAEWMAVSHSAHRRIEENKAWARERGYLRPF